MNIDIFNRLLCKKVNTDNDIDYTIEHEPSLFIIQPKYTELPTNNIIKKTNKPTMYTCYSCMFLCDMCTDVYEYIWKK
jgi:hypothetical protein